MNGPINKFRTRRGLQSLYSAMKESLKKPPIGVTQGGSSRKNSGARSAAKVSKVKQPQQGQ